MESNSSSNHALLSLVAFGTFFLHQSHYESLKFRHLITLYFRWLLLELFSLHQSHYESLKFRHLNFRWLPLELFSLHQKPLITSSNHALSHYESLKFRHLITLYFRWLPLELFSFSKESLFHPPSNSFPSIKAHSTFPLFSQIPSSNHALLSFGSFELLHQSHYESLKFRHLITLYFRWLPLELFSLHQSHYESLKFRHLITLYFRWLPLLFPSIWNSVINHASLVAFGTLFPLHQSHYESLYFRWFTHSFPSIKAIMSLQKLSFSLHQSHSVSQIPHYESLKFRHLITLYFRWLPLELFSLHQSHYESLKFRHLITLYFRWLPFELFSLHQSHYESLKFRHLITLITFVGCLWNSFPSIKAIMSLKFRHLITLYFRWLPLELFSLHQSHYESLKFRHLITLYFRWLPLELFFLHQSHYESLKFRHLITLYFRWLPLELFSLHQSHYESLKFRHLITLYFLLVAFGTLFPSIKAIMSLSNSVI
ncbi:unnamed protein product [Acanthosepion pharaonis]|uniref:Uncharacterized protein n=1 Tax=Acanthosepion pharaonis TaxID=158019 RepID=A0A812EF47_ACAPH|nr:unnamed protein product [Sepia pharaonis]